MHEREAVAPTDGLERAITNGVGRPGPTGREAHGGRERARGRLRFDVAIVGAGLSGVSTALHLKRTAPGLSVAILEARSVASGASGRGTGLLGPRGGPDILAARRRYGAHAARAMYLARVEAVDDALRLIDEYGIACGLERAPQLLVARSQRDAQELHARAAAYSALSLDVRLLDARQLAALFDGPYRQGLCFPTAASLDPGALTEGLARAAERLGVAIFEASPVRAIHPGAPVRIVLRDAEIRARQVALATNAYPLGSEASTPIVPLVVQALSSVPLSAAQLARLGWRNRNAIVEWGLGAPYFRLTPDQRIVLGGGSAVAPSSGSADSQPAEARNWRLQERWLRALHPALHDLEVSHRWSGRVAMTRDFLPKVGPHASEIGLHSAAGWCGSGLALSLRSGRALAASLLAEQVPDAALPWWRSSAPGVWQNRLTNLALRGGLFLLAHHVARARGPRTQAAHPQAPASVGSG